METAEAVEVGYVTRVAEGLLHFEGVLPGDELLARVVELVRPGSWYTPQRGAEILAANPALRPPTSRGFIGLKDELDELYKVPEKHADDWAKWLTRLWEQTPRYELGGRTPVEAERMTKAQEKEIARSRKKR
jgi:hypothetical protein